MGSRLLQAQPLSGKREPIPNLFRKRDAGSAAQSSASQVTTVRLAIRSNSRTRAVIGPEARLKIEDGVCVGEDSRWQIDRLWRAIADLGKILVERFEGGEKWRKARLRCGLRDLSLLLVHDHILIRQFFPGIPRKCRGGEGDSQHPPVGGKPGIASG